ncbi:ribosomal protection-like ABC-F family protein [Geomicrobium sp. JCM 19038]|uniref:ribosomal protection-like ABC-F family protein n=1 Tax=Geomicrobium sp. JCM 19038 TaxID=1460635 RepID=UPI00045F1279|nr:ATP-binding cassette domain-containing protein [Geomicrobium sp. JCM 19038]GAK08787.1 macrolide-specific ABC-type efflux carrier [Geomicrobium sp. JCM 19038]
MEQVQLEMNQVTLTFGDRQVLDIESLRVHQLDRIGIVGKNGSGKSSLLKLLEGSLRPTTGHVKKHIEFGYYEQLSAPKVDVHQLDGELSSRLAVPMDAGEQMSGGEETRTKLAALLSTYYEGMLLDEPTTHLDQAGIDFVMEELSYYYGTLLLISHDRRVLDELVTKVWEIDDGKVTEYVGNYSQYVETKDEERQKQREEHDHYVKERDRLHKAVEDKKKHAQKVGKGSKGQPNANRMFMTKDKGTSQKGIMKSAKAMEQRLEQMEKIQAPDIMQPIVFHKPKALELHNRIPIMTDRATIKIADRLLIENVSLQLPLGKTIAFTGHNGSGKSTLLDYIVNGQEGITRSPKVKFGVFKQKDFRFTKEMSVYGWMKERSEQSEKTIRAVLSSMQFSGNDLKKSVQDLSGGEAIRLVLSQLFLGNYNVLVLDEPTNFWISKVSKR